MALVDIFTNLFSKKEVSEDEKVIKTIRRMGYKGEGGSYVKNSSNGVTILTIMVTGIKLKIYTPGFSESEFLPGPFPDMERVKKFIRSNEL